MWNTGDLLDQARRAHPPLDLDPGEALALLTASGGHPRLILEALHGRARGRGLSDCIAGLAHSVQIEAQFSAIAQDPDRRRDLKERLARSDLGAFRTWIGDPLLRRLYWLNLLRAEGPAGQERLLVWRCPAVVRAGLRVLSSSSPAGRINTPPIKVCSYGTLVPIAVVGSPRTTGSNRLARPLSRG